MQMQSTLGISQIAVLSLLNTLIDYTAKYFLFSNLQESEISVSSKNPADGYDWLDF